MITSARMTNKETIGELRCNATTVGSLGRDTSTGHMKSSGCMVEIK